MVWSNAVVLDFSAKPAMATTGGSNRTYDRPEALHAAASAFSGASRDEARKGSWTDCVSLVQHK